MSKKKLLSSFFILLGVIGFFLIGYQIYSFNNILMDNLDLYYPASTNNNLGGWNLFSYFTILSNILVNSYLIVVGLAGLNVKFAKPIARNVYIQGALTVYIFITGFVFYVVLFPFLKFYPWDSPMAFSNIINIWNHAITPIIMLILWLFPFTNQRLGKKFMLGTLSFPIAYFIFSVIRGHFMDPHWYPYPFLNPEYLWNSLIKNKPFDDLWGTLLFVIFFSLIVGLFVGVIVLMKKVRNKIVSLWVYEFKE